MKKLISKIRLYIADPYRDFSEKMFLGFAVITEIAVFIGFVIEVVFGHDMIEMLVMASILVL